MKRILTSLYTEVELTKSTWVTEDAEMAGISITMPFWDERFNQMKKNYPDIETDQFHIDILVARFVLNPEWFDVVVASNLFGDILSNRNPFLNERQIIGREQRRHPSLTGHSADPRARKTPS